MAFEGAGKFFAGEDASLDHDERLRLHETVLVRHADYGRFEHALMSDAVHRSSPIIAHHRIVYSMGTILSNLLAEATLVKQRKRQQASYAHCLQMHDAGSGPKTGRSATAGVCFALRPEALARAVA
jgi:hypothetical protein